MQQQTETAIATDYRQRAERAEMNQRQVQQQILRISLLRVILFTGGIAAAIALDVGRRTGSDDAAFPRPRQVP